MEPVDWDSHALMLWDSIVLPFIPHSQFGDDNDAYKEQGGGGEEGTSSFSKGKRQRGPWAPQVKTSENTQSALSQGSLSNGFFTIRLVNCYPVSLAHQ